MRILLTTYAFPDDRQAFMEEYVLALLALGIEVCVVASAGRDPAPKLRADGGGSSLEIVHASWTDPRHKKLVTLLTTMGRAARHHRAELRKLVVALHRRHGFGRALLAAVCAHADPLAASRRRASRVAHRGGAVARSPPRSTLPSS